MSNFKPLGLTKIPRSSLNSQVAAMWMFFAFKRLLLNRLFQTMSLDECGELFALEPNNSFRDAVEIPTNRLVRSRLSPGDATDLFLFKTNNAQPSFTIRLADGTDLSARLYRYDAQTDMLIFLNTLIHQDTLNLPSREAGTYLLEISTVQTNFSRCYGLSIDTHAFTPFVPFYDVHLDSLIHPMTHSYDSVLYVTFPMTNRSNVTIHEIQIYVELDGIRQVFRKFILGTEPNHSYSSVDIGPITSHLPYGRHRLKCWLGLIDNQFRDERPQDTFDLNFIRHQLPQIRIDSPRANQIIAPGEMAKLSILQEDSLAPIQQVEWNFVATFGVGSSFTDTSRIRPFSYRIAPFFIQINTFLYKNGPSFKKIS
jgi:hypothetical protein